MTDANDPIPQITRDDEAAGSGDLVADNIARLKALFPAIVTDGKVDFDVLRELLGDAVEEGEERYGLNWKGKRKARAFALTPSLATLLPAPEDSVDWDTTQNLMIEGDNLEVLKLLRRSYAGKVKLIYIDPPYNTGSDFVYPDNYQQPLRSYMLLSGQASEKGESLSSDRESAGRLHTAWLNMIYPRMIIAKEILRDDGVIFVSCDEEEQANLRHVLQDVFGEENFVANVIWQKKFARQNDARFFSTMHDFLICVSKRPVAEDSNGWSIGLIPRGDEAPSGYSNVDDDPRGLWASVVLSTKSGSEKLRYEIVTPSGRRCLPPAGRYWAYSETRLKQLIADNRIWFGKSGDGVPRLKTFLSEVQDGLRPNTMWFHQEVGHNQGARQSLKAMFGGDAVFDSPKPVSLIRMVMTVANVQKDDLVVDFFAGSGSTGEAVMTANGEDGGLRRFLLVQLPEPLDAFKEESKLAAEFLGKIKKPFNIAELTKERLRRAGAKIREEHPDVKVDTGFRVYKLATSNLKPWQPDAENLEANILDAVDNVLPGRTEEDLLVELLLKTGIDLTLPEEKRTIAGQTVHALGSGTLMICLGNIGADDAEALGQGMADWVDELDPVQTTVYFKDTGLGADGNRAATKANLAAILRQRLGDRIAKIASI